MDTKVTDQPPFGSVEQYAQLLRRTTRRRPEFLESCAFAIVQVVAADPFISDAHKVRLIKNLATAVQLVEDEPDPAAPAEPAPVDGRLGEVADEPVPCYVPNGFQAPEVIAERQADCAARHPGRACDVPASAE